MNGRLAELGTRIQVVGPSCAGKTTLARELARRLGGEFLELDALFWLPGWTEPDPADFAEALRSATAGDHWVAAGNYIRHTVPVYWERLDTVVWLDFPLRVTIPRILRRSWRRWRRRELLWGSNHEQFWQQLKVWSPKDSLIAYNVLRRKQQRERFEALRRDPALADIRWVRLRSPKQARRWLESRGA